MSTYYATDYATAGPELCAEELARMRKIAASHRAQAARADAEAVKWQAALDAHATRDDEGATS